MYEYQCTDLFEGVIFFNKVTTFGGMGRSRK